MGFNWGTLLSGGIYQPEDKGGGDGGGAGPTLDFVDTRNSDQRKIDSNFSDFISKYLPGYVPGQAYTGKLSAPASPYENQGLNYLQKFLDNPDPSGLMGNASNVLNKTLTGGYDPYTSPYYKSLRQGAQIEQGDAQNQLNAQLGARGKYFSSEALNENQQLQTRTTNYLQNILGQLAQTERQNQLSAVPQAADLNNKVTLAPVAAASTFGALPRELEQKDLENAYQSFLNSRSELSSIPGLARGTFSGTSLKTLADNSGSGSDSQPGFDWQSFLGELGTKAASAALFA